MVRQIISGQQLPKIKDDARTVDPSVEVAVVTPGSGYDGSQRRRTKVIKCVCRRRLALEHV